MILKLVSIILILYSVSAEISALALGGDSKDNEVALAYLMDMSTYVLAVRNSFSYAYTGTPFTICFRERPVIITNDTCELGNTYIIQLIKVATMNAWECRSHLKTAKPQVITPNGHYKAIC